MSYLPTQGGHSTFLPVKIRSGAPVSVYPIYSPSPIFAIEPGTKYINVILTIVSAAPFDYHVRMAYTLDAEPTIPGQFDLLRAEIYNPGPPARFEQIILEKRFTGLPAPGGTVIVTFPITDISSKWGIIDVSCSSAVPNISISIVQGR